MQIISKDEPLYLLMQEFREWGRQCDSYLEDKRNKKPSVRPPSIDELIPILKEKYSVSIKNKD